MGRQAAYAGLYRLYGNAITKNGVFADHEKMLLHRVGAITCDMLFDPLTATMVDYKAYMVGAKFLLHTETYSMEENEVGLTTRCNIRWMTGGGHTPVSESRRLP